jgi:methylated-DNA-[protein]-cysteine S-methyltransferase
MNPTIYYDYLDSPLGTLVVEGDGEFITGLYLPQHKGWSGPSADWQRSAAPFAAMREQLAAYFSGDLRTFDLPLKPAGTLFQQRVWCELTRIGFGTTITYAQLAARVGQPSASRAVGHANGRNPISIIVPCHRVVGTGGKLTGYAGGLDKKQRLLDWEREASQSVRASFRLESAAKG